MNPRPLFNFARQSFEKKVRMLGRFGITDVSASGPFEKVKAQTFTPEGCHIQLWLLLLEQVFPKLMSYSPELLHIFFSESVEDEYARNKVQSEIRNSILESGRHLFPVHCPQSAEHPDGHWTLLSLERKENEVSVRYYETLDEVNEVCMGRAKQLLERIGVEAEVERTNTFRQVADDCVWWVCHYAEVEAREAHGEGLGACFAIGNALRKPQIRQCLKLASDQLEAARLKWLEQEQMDELQRESVRKMLEIQRGRMQFCRDEVERLRTRAAMAARALLSGTKDLPDPEVIVLSKKASNDSIEKEVEEALQEIEALGWEQEKEAEQQKKAEKVQEKVCEQQQQAEEEQEKESEQQEVILCRLDKGFGKWLRQKNEFQLERIVKQVMSGHKFEQDTKAYLDCVHSTESMVRFCTKCRRGGCEYCDYIHALRYVVRWQKPAAWWKRTGQNAVLGSVRFLRASNASSSK